MSQDYASYQKRAAERAQRAAQGGEGKTFQKIGFFKLKHDGDVALVRINVSKPEELMLADYHQLDASTKFMKVECTGAGCPFCAEAEKQAEANKKDKNSPIKVSKAKARVFVPMLVSYRQPDNTFSAPEPVIMDAPAAGKSDFVKPLVDKLIDFGPLGAHVFKLTRRGEQLDTTYALDYVPTYDNDSIIPNDFSAFANFRIDKHSYWVKTNEEMNTFLATGQFPATATATATAAPVTAATTANAVDVTDVMAAAEQAPHFTQATEAPTSTAATTATTETKAAEAETPRRNPNFQAHW